jgi:hypothetical protein
MQRLKKRYKSSCLGGIEILSVCGHIAATLEYLAHELIASQANGDGIEGRPPFSTDSPKRMAIVALLLLKHQGALDLSRRSSAHKLQWDGAAVDASITGLHGA